MSKKDGTTTPVDYKFPEPPKTSFLTFLYNPKENTYLGRTPKNWGELCVFYTVFYIVLSILFAICMFGLLSTLSDLEPKWKLESSLIGTNPGLGFRPYNGEWKSSAIINLQPRKNASSRYWAGLLDEFFDSYIKINDSNCEYFNPNSSKEVCEVDLESFGPCNRNESYGYADGRPCVFLKLNKIFNWLPFPYTDMDDLPHDMPSALKKELKDLYNTNRTELEKVWVTCDGYSTIDKENVGTISFYPSNGFHTYYFPYQNQPGYQSPLIAVQFENIKKHNLVNVECRAWAQNIIFSRNGNVGRKGSVVFQLLID